MKKIELNGRWLSYGIVIVLGMTGMLVDKYSDFELVEKYIPNINSEILGIFITIALIENLLHFDAKRRTKKIREVALRKLRIPAKKIAELFAQMIKASMEAKPEVEPKDFAEMFSAPKVYMALHHLNLGSNAPVVPKRDWYQYMNEVLNFNLGQMDDIIMGYMESFSPEEVEVVEAIGQSQLILMIKGLVNVPHVLKTNGHSSDLPLLSCIEEKELGKEMKKLVDLLQITGLEPIPAGFWLDTVSPKIGENRMEAIPKMPNGGIPLETRQ